MAVSKTLRFAIFDRDDRTCRYCGQTAPDVKITVDHVIPKTLGGRDEPENLVTACWDCNIGKGAASPSAEVVADVAEDTLRYAQLAKQAWAVRVEEIERERSYTDEASESIDFPVPPEWRSSIGRFYTLGVPLEAVQEAARLASDKWQYSRSMDRFKYMCGILWNQCREVNGAIAESLDMDGCWYTENDLDDLRYEAFREGWSRGQKDGFSKGVFKPDPITMLIHHHVEGSFARVAGAWADGREALASCG